MGFSGMGELNISFYLLIKVKLRALSVNMNWMVLLVIINSC